MPVPISPAAAYFVPTLPLLPPASSLHTPLFQSAGYLPARAPGAGTGPAGDAHLYFVLQRARHTAEKRRLIVWFNGGPGCSSFDGLMMEIGAFRPDRAGGLEWTTPGGAWNEYADVLFLDQPVGTGFSYASTSAYATSLEQAGAEVTYAMQRFVETFPEYAAGNGVDTYLAGESYAGQYIPFTAASLVKAAQPPLDVRGIVMGNPFIDPRAQAGSEIEMMVEAKLWEKGGKEWSEANKVYEECQRQLKSFHDDPREAGSCGRILHKVIDITIETTPKVQGKDMCINIYDVRLSDTSPECGMNWPPTLRPTYDYLARADVRKALHVNEQAKPEAWIECNHRVSSALRDERSPQSSKIHIPELLERGIKVMLFAGDQDLICNHIGVERVPRFLKWSGASSWESNAVKKDWFVNNTLAGYWREASNLTYVSVAGASHMVGFDRPVQSHDMMLRFMGVDLLGAAGPSSRIPSRLDGEPDHMLVVGGGGGGGGVSDDRPMIPGVDGKSEEQVKQEAKWAAYYDAGSAALVILLILVAAGGYILLRLRRNARRAGQLLGRGAASQSAEGDLELEHLVGDEEDTPRGAAPGRYSDETFRAGGGGEGKGKGREQVRDDEEVFHVGSGDEEEKER